MKRGTRTLTAALLVVLVLSSGGGVVAYRTAHAVGLVESIIARSIVRTISLKEAEQRDRGNINRRRDAELADIALREQAVTLQVASGSMSEADAARERQRYEWLGEAVTERAKRERQVTSFQTRNRIRQNLRETLPDAIKVATGADPRAIDFLTSMLRGERPLTALVDAATGGAGDVVDPRQQFLDLQSTLEEVERTARALGGVQGLAVRARIQQALTEVSGVPIGDGEIPDDKLQRLRDLDAQIQAVVAQAGAIGRDLFPGSEGIDRSRFEGNEIWEQLNRTVEALSEPVAGRQIASSLLRNAIADIERLSEGAGLGLSDDQVAAIAGAVLRATLDERTAGGNGLATGGTLLEDLVRGAVNEELAVTGRAPLPGPTSEPGSPPTVAPTPASGGAPATATAATPSATATAATPRATATAATPRATATAATPAATASRTPTPTRTATASPTATATESPATPFTLRGSIFEPVANGTVDSLSSTAVIAVDYASGTISGTLAGSGGSERLFPCSFPDGPTLDTATVAYTSSYQATLSGTVDPASGAGGGTITVSGSVSFTLIGPFTHSDCIHLNSEPAPGLGGWSGSGTFSGSFAPTGGDLSTNWTAGSAVTAGGGALSP